MTTITVTPTHFVVVDLATGETTKYDNRQCSITISGTNVTVDPEPDEETMKLNCVAMIEKYYDHCIAAILSMFPNLTFARLRETTIMCIPLAKIFARRHSLNFSEELIDFCIEAAVHKIRISAAPPSTSTAPIASTPEFDKAMEELARNPSEIPTAPPPEVIAMFERFAPKPPLTPICAQRPKVTVQTTHFVVGGTCPFDCPAPAQVPRTTPITPSDISGPPTRPVPEPIYIGGKQVGTTASDSMHTGYTPSDISGPETPPQTIVYSSNLSPAIIASLERLIPGVILVPRSVPMTVPSVPFMDM